MPCFSEVSEVSVAFFLGSKFSLPASAFGREGSGGGGGRGVFGGGGVITTCSTAFMLPFLQLRLTCRARSGRSSLRFITLGVVAFRLNHIGVFRALDFEAP